MAGFFGRYAAQFAIATTTDGLNLGIDHLLDALRADPTRISLIGTEWPLSSTDGITIVPVKPVPRFLWWALCHRVTRHPRRDGWLDYNPNRDWLPDPDRTDLLAWTTAAST